MIVGLHEHGENVWIRSTEQVEQNENADSFQSCVILHNNFLEGRERRKKRNEGRREGRKEGVKRGREGRKEVNENKEDEGRKKPSRTLLHFSAV